MDEHKSKSSYEIRQSWVVSSFLPPPNKQNVEKEAPEVSFEKFRIDECIGCEDRDWNVPEMLVEFRMAAEVAGVIAPLYEYSYPVDPREHSYGTIQAGLFLVFQLLRNWALDYKHSRIALERVYEDKQEFLDFWNKNKTIIYKLRPASKGSISCTFPSSGEIHDVLRKFTELLEKDVLLQQYCWPDLKNGLEEYFREIDTSKSRHNKSKSLDQLGLLLYRFCRSYLSRSKETAAGKKIHTIEKRLRELPAYSELSKDLNLPRCNKWNNEYLDAVGQLLQKTANVVGNILNSGEGNNHEGAVLYLATYRPHSVSKMLRSVKNAMKSVGIDEQDIISYIQETRKKHHRKCVAMLDSNNLPHKIVAFSGYADSNDPYIIEYLDGGRLYNDLRMLCHAYHLVFANLSPEVVSKIVRFDKNKLKGPMRNELFDVYVASQSSSAKEIKKEVRKKIGVNYSCCERKILAKVEVNHLSPKRAQLCIKFSPCSSCKKALRYYQKLYGWNWNESYLYKY